MSDAFDGLDVSGARAVHTWDALADQIIQRHPFLTAAAAKGLRKLAASSASTAQYDDTGSGPQVHNIMLGADIASEHYGLDQLPAMVSAFPRPAQRKGGDLPVRALRG